MEALFSRGEVPLNESTWSSDDLELHRDDLTYLEKVGEGKTADVYRGVWMGTNVAIKSYRAALERDIMDTEQRATFKREVAVNCNVQHPNIVRLLGVVSIDNPVLVVSEYCGGGCLFDLLHLRAHDIPLTWPQKVKMAMDTATAMDYLHGLDPPVIHRDLKSLNLLLSESVTCAQDVPFVKVADFGVSRNSNNKIMTDGLGTTYWMAPEMLEHESYDEKVDVHSFGMVMYEVIARDIPFRREPQRMVVLLIARGKRPEMSQLPADCPRSLSSLMQSCWAHDPQDRPPFTSIKDSLSDISRFLSDPLWQYAL
eukprot:gnl/TRDRNA2_/TRDRNA2_205276_c0_seq1.p1 gnl/TRDRNA2_/TRDRNA2_205276_c0~~gnl/TRDRNA2_/TRDRNA2_205276_c0_seq1.p1  ORF type:complete len:311 (-),score=33.56 gnl/TRDRNA2_/TRDRNA2_205276_c0_seq1:45-977(-)